MPTKAPTHKPKPVKAKTHGRQDRQQRRALHTDTKAWRNQRERVLQRDAFTCRHCGRYGNQVDHTRNNAADLVTDDELQTLCLACHSAKTMREMNEAVRTHRIARAPD